jgi:hypothetical protein
VPDEDSLQAAHRALVDRVLTGVGAASAEERARAFTTGDLPPGVPIGELTEADLAVAKAAGYTEDQLFELVICAAVGQSSRLYDAGLAALAEATGRPDDAA